MASRRCAVGAVDAATVRRMNDASARLARGGRFGLSRDEWNELQARLIAAGIWIGAGGAAQTARTRDDD